MYSSTLTVMKTTRHAKTRMQQRSIPQLVYAVIGADSSLITVCHRDERIRRH